MLAFRIDSCGYRNPNDTSSFDICGEALSDAQLSLVGCCSCHWSDAVAIEAISTPLKIVQAPFFGNLSRYRVMQVVRSSFVRPLHWPEGLDDDRGDLPLSWTSRFWSNTKWPLVSNAHSAFCLKKSRQMLKYLDDTKFDQTQNDKVLWHVHMRMIATGRML